MGSLLKRCKQYFWDVFVNTILASYLCPLTLRKTLLQLVGIKYSKASIQGGCYFTSNKIIIGAGSYINRGCFLSNHDFVKIGENCSIGCRVSFLTANHVISDSTKRGGKLDTKEITVGNGVWIGANAVIAPGVSIGDGVVIGAGSVVSKDCNPNGLYVGAPAKRIKELN